MRYHSKAMGETLVKMQNHIHTLRGDMDKAYFCLQKSQRKEALLILAESLGLESDEFPESNTEREKK